MHAPGLRRFRRLALLVALPSIGALALTACSGSDSDSGSGSGGSADSFSFAFGSATGQESPWETMAKKYTQETGVKVETKALPPDSYGVALRTQLQGGNAPDTFVVSPGAGQDSSVVPLASAGLLEPLDAKSAAVIPKGSEGLFTVDGKVYAQPTDLIPVGMVWNSGAATKTNVNAAADTNQLLSDCKTLADDGKSYIALAGSVPPNPGLMGMAVSATRVYAETPDWNTQRAEGKVTFADSQGWKDTLQTVIDLNKGGCFQKGAAGGGFDAITQGITQGTSLAAFVPGGAATELMNATPGLKLEIQPFPPASGGDPYVLASPNYALSVSKKSDSAQKKAAQAFLAWMAEPDNAVEFTKISGGVAITGPDANLSPVYAPVKDLLEKGSYAPLPNLEWPNPAVYDTLAQGIQGLIAGKGDIDSVLQATDKAWGE